MSSNLLSSIDLRRTLSSPDFVAANAFHAMRSLSSLHDEIGENEFQELVLRALEHRDLLGESKAILDGLVREVGLFPFLNPEELGFADRIAYEYHKPDNMSEQSVVFHRPQARVYRELMAGKNVFLSAPTSFGKSLIIDAVVLSNKYKNILVIVPTIALIDETRRRLSKLGSSYKVITHSFQTPAERNVYIYTQERALEHVNVDPIDFFIIDEFYKLAPNRDGEGRASLLNHVFYKLASKGKQFYMLGPSVTGITPELKSRIEYTFIHEPYITVVSEVQRVKREGDEFDTLEKLCKEKIDGPTIIFCKSPARASEIALQLIERGVGEPTQELSDAVNWIGSHYHPGWHFVRALSQGIGIHHGRIPRALSQYIVRAFDNDAIQFLICTSTLIEGVNTKARNIIIFDNKINNQKFDYFTFNNIKGRSGRMFKHFIGHVYLFHEPPQETLPFIDIPVITQSDDAPDSLLIQIDETDLTDHSRDRLKEYREQDVLSYETLKANAGVDPEAQIAVAETILSKLSYYRPLLNWSHHPTFDQLYGICKLIWEHFDGRNLGAGSVRSAKQLAFQINQLQTRPSVSELIRDRLNYENDPDKAVPKVLDFLRLWAGFNFPKLLRAINTIQKDVLSRKGIPAGNFNSFAYRVENLFLDPALIALDEYGIPLELAIKLTNFLRPNGNLDEVLQRLKVLDIKRLNLLPFEREILTEAQSNIQFQQ